MESAMEVQCSSLVQIWVGKVQNGYVIEFDSDPGGNDPTTQQSFVLKDEGSVGAFIQAQIVAARMAAPALAKSSARPKGLK